MTYSRSRLKPKRRFQLVCFCVLAIVGAGCGPTYRSNRLISKLQDKDPKVRDDAAGGLVKLGAPAVDPLIRALNSPDGNLRTRVSDVLVKIGEPAVDPLIDAFTNSDGEMRPRLSEVLTRIGEPSVL